jgi:hypothetical protein
VHAFCIKRLASILFLFFSSRGFTQVATIHVYFAGIHLRCMLVRVKFRVRVTLLTFTFAVCWFSPHPLAQAAAAAKTQELVQAAQGLARTNNANAAAAARATVTAQVPVQAHMNHGQPGGQSVKMEGGIVSNESAPTPTAVASTAVDPAAALAAAIGTSGDVAGAVASGTVPFTVGIDGKEAVARIAAMEGATADGTGPGDAAAAAAAAVLVAGAAGTGVIADVDGAAAAAAATLVAASYANRPNAITRVDPANLPGFTPAASGQTQFLHGDRSAPNSACARGSFLIRCLWVVRYGGQCVMVGSVLWWAVCYGG